MDLKFQNDGRFKLNPEKFGLGPPSLQGIRLKPSLAKKPVPELVRIMTDAMHPTLRKPRDPMQNAMAAAIQKLRGPQNRAGAAAQAEVGPRWDSRSPGPLPVDRTLLRSSNLHAVTYYPERASLMVEFPNGSVHEYLNVPPTVYAGLMRADSHGKFFHANIRDRFGGRRIA